VFPRLVEDPKRALYLVILTGPFTSVYLPIGGFKKFAVSEIAGVFLIAAWFLNKTFLPRNEKRTLTPLGPWFLFLGWMILFSTLVNMYQYILIDRLFAELLTIGYVTIFFLLFERLIQTEEDVKRVIKMTLISAMIVIGLGSWDAMASLFGFFHIVGPFKRSTAWRIASTFKTSGQLGIYLLTLFWITLASFFIPNLSRRKKVGLLVLLCGIGITAIFAVRRSTYPGYVIGLMFLGLLSIKSPKQLVGIGFAALAVVCVVFSVLTFNEDFTAYFLREVSIFENIQKHTFFTYQIPVLTKTFLDSPVFGIGYSRFRTAPYNVKGVEVHSGILQILVETGIIGFIVYLIFLGLILKLAYENAFRLNNAWTKFNMVIFAAIPGFYVTYGYTRHLRERTFWILVGLIAVINNIGKLRGNSGTEEGHCSQRDGA
jgi:O-antigen ligase